MEIKEKLGNIVNWLNSNYNQDSEKYSIFNGAKPEVIRYDEHTAISLWACGAIVCYKSILYFIGEDDGHWLYCLWYNSNEIIHSPCGVYCDNLIDACYEMILKLHQMELL